MIVQTMIYEIWLLEFQFFFRNVLVVWLSLLLNLSTPDFLICKMDMISTVPTSLGM